MSAPTLLVGLGGTGSKIVAKVSDMISEDQRRNISCVIFDTDANDIPLIKATNPEIKVVQTSARMTVGEYLEEDHNARDEWFPVNPPLDRKVLSEGAGQVRSISRLGFESALRTGNMKPLHDAIQDLYKVDDNQADQALRVMIVSSLAGGTGSGLIVPAAMYIRSYLEKNFNRNANICRGFFILPEVFYDAIPADQRNNLRSNAYASLRELDAFLMKGNKMLPEEYMDSVRLEMPVEGTGQKEDYDVSPYDFCFLFDAQNSHGEKLNSLEQYMNHAANILYSMSIGPMYKRSNSSEDNVLRKLAKEKGRNRYAGAGASRLVYPYDDICRVIGLSWASKSISDNWMEYDRRFEEQQKIALAKREEGYVVEDVDRSQCYIDSINADKEAGKAFASSIVQAVKPQRIDSDEEEENQTTIYNEYLDALQDYIQQSVAENEGLRTIRKEIEQSVSGAESAESIEDMKELLNKALKNLKKYKAQIDRYVSLDSSNRAYSVFEGANNEGDLDKKYFLESIIRPGGKYLHPNAMRYFLIYARNEMDQRMIDAKSKRDKEEENFKSYISNPWEVNGGNLDEYKPSGLFRRSQKRIKELRGEMESLDSIAKKMDSYAQDSMQAELFEHGLKYLDSMIEGFEAFYDAFGGQLKQIEERKEEIYNKYTQAPGMTVRYVLASRACLDGLRERYPYTGSLLSVDSDLSKRIATKVFEYAGKKTKPNPSRYFGDLFEEQILTHYQEAANKRIAGELDQGIMHAMELEADLMLDEEDRDNRRAVDQYVRNVISSTRALSTPFIEKPNELDATVIDSCAYNTSLVPARGEETYEAKLINEELVAKGGTADDDINQNLIMFYQAYYGLRANRLSKFAPPRDSETFKRNGGEYFNAYADLIKGIHPNSRLSQEITPHIDKRWHLAAKMPDLDEENQKFEEYAINAAFFWAVVYDLLDLWEESDGSRYYELKKIRLGLEDGTLLADGKRKSSKLYEVRDGLAILPAFVSQIRSYAASREQDDLKSGLVADETSTYEAMETMDLLLDPAEYHLDEKEYKNGKHVSIYHLPLLVKMSMPAGSADQTKLLEILQVALRESVRYISGFCSPEEVAGFVGNYVDNQLLQYQAEIDNETFIGEQARMDSLSADMLDVTSNFLKEFGLHKEAEAVQKKANEMKRDRKGRSSRSR